jgi:hypothetical protein
MHSTLLLGTRLQTAAGCLAPQLLLAVLHRLMRAQAVLAALGLQQLAVHVLLLLQRHLRSWLRPQSHQTRHRHHRPNLLLLQLLMVVVVVLLLLHCWRQQQQQCQQRVCLALLLAVWPGQQQRLCCLLRL